METGSWGPLLWLCSSRTAQSLERACGEGKTRSRQSPWTEYSQFVGSKGSCHSGQEYQVGDRDYITDTPHSRKNYISYLWNFRPILLARAWSSNTVWPQAALISFHSTGTLGRRPSLKLLIVPNCPLCLQEKGREKYRQNLKLSKFWNFLLSPKTWHKSLSLSPDSYIQALLGSLNTCLKRESSSFSLLLRRQSRNLGIILECSLSQLPSPQHHQALLSLPPKPLKSAHFSSDSMLWLYPLLFRFLLTSFLTNNLALLPQVISHITGKAIIHKCNCTHVTFLTKMLQWLPLPFGQSPYPLMRPTRSFRKW